MNHEQQELYDKLKSLKVCDFLDLYLVKELSDFSIGTSFRIYCFPYTAPDIYAIYNASPNDKDNSYRDYYTAEQAVEYFSLYSSKDDSFINSLYDS